MTKSDKKAINLSRNVIRVTALASVLLMAKEAAKGQPFAMMLLAAALGALDYAGRQERKVSVVSQKARDKVLGASFTDTLKHHANNVTVGLRVADDKVKEGLKILFAA